ncbi:hypothetical protein [Micromonospora antibiotica]|uniref:Uncharacterized protein n=1 Tax=Micromonospora antibiotica TaxID=2807623 RepID=A0ABS3VGT1_9ACTN|nr:hypothetical protein [Micromonospora antibiotica]MBO4164759.1 hypothetical protein [Micromonospora antibiotica]
MIPQTFACSRDGLAAVLLGGYDGAGSWSIAAPQIRGDDEQLLVETHEGLHHELQSSTGYGLVAALSARLSGRGVSRYRLREVFHEMVVRSRQVHEVFATTLAAGVVGVDLTRRLLSDNTDYTGHLETGLRLAGPGVPEPRRATVAAAVLRCCMAPAGVSTLISSGFRRLSREHLAADDLTPDVRLDRFRAARAGPELGRMVRDLAGAPEGELMRATYEHARHVLDRVGLPSVAWADQAEVAEALRAAVGAVDTDLAARLNIVTGRRPLLDDGLEYDRQKVVLRDRLPAEVSILTDAEQASRSFGGSFVCAVWMRRDVLAKQFRLPATPPLPDLVAALIDGGGTEPVVRLGLLPDGMTPGEVQTWLGPVPVVALTTHLTLAAPEADALLRRSSPVLVLMDLPVAWHVADWLRQGATVRLAPTPLDSPFGGVELWLAVFAIDRRPGLRFLAVGGKVGVSVLLERLRQRHGERLVIDGALLSTEASVVNAVLTRVFDTWHVFDQDAVE